MCKGSGTDDEGVPDLMRLNVANDRVAEAEQARYLAEEVKRLTEEKYTLYKVRK